jgi:hypothetical protein
MTATAHEVADTLNRAFDEPSMTMAILLADISRRSRSSIRRQPPRRTRTAIATGSSCTTAASSSTTPAPNAGSSAALKGSLHPTSDA